MKSITKEVGKSHSEIADTAFQVLTIAVTALFSLLAVLHTAALIV
jgi:hypothetical protein